MTQVVRWYPFSEFRGLNRAMDRLFGDFTTTRLRRVSEPSPLTFPVDITETDSDVTVNATLPGTKPQDVEITVSEGVLTIRGESRHEETDEKENYYRREIRRGAFSRSLPLPANVDEEQAEAEFTDGVLQIRLPKTDDARPKTIKVKAAGGELASAAA